MTKFIKPLVLIIVILTILVGCANSQNRNFQYENSVSDEIEKDQQIIIRLKQKRF